jgi:epoxyqueuosine reductase
LLNSAAWAPTPNRNRHKLHRQKTDFVYSPDMTLLQQHTHFLKQKAAELGFSACGVSAARFLESEAPRLENWLNKNMHGEMHYMANHFDMRLDPRKLVPGAKSVVSLLYNYYTDKKQTDDAAPVLSKYAYGEDYHRVVKDKLKTLLQLLQHEIGLIQGRAFVDSAPVLERAWAIQSGIGWMGKNTNIINKQKGSYFFLAELIVDCEFEYDSPVTDHCGTCTACIDACPTEAIIEPYVVDGSKCISYFTIELRNAIPVDLKGKFENRMFGCDICQDVCPWNRFSTPHTESRFNPAETVMKMSRNEWIELTEDVFNELFKKSAVKRTRYNGLKRNIDFLYNPN